MLAGSGAHHDDAGLRAGNHRCRLAEGHALHDCRAAVLQRGRIRTACQVLRGLGTAHSGIERRGSAGSGRALCGILLDNGFRAAFGENLVGFVQQILEILFQRFPEAILRFVFDLDTRGVATTDRISARSDGTGRNLRVRRNGTDHITRQIDVIDLVILQIRRIGHHRQIGAVKLVAHVDLLGDAGQQLRQGLVNGVQRHVTGNTRMHIDVELGVAGQGKEQILNADIVDHNTVGFGLGPGLGARQGHALLHGSRNGATRFRHTFRAQMGWRGRIAESGRSAGHHSQGKQAASSDFQQARFRWTMKWFFHKPSGITAQVTDFYWRIVDRKKPGWQ